MIALLTLAGAAALVTLARSGPPSPEPASAVTSAAARQPYPPEGRRVFLRDCAWCHGNQGQGSPTGPSLEQSGPATADFMLRTGRMPLSSPKQQAQSGPPAYSSKTISALVDYVATLGSGPAIPTVQPGDLGKGESLFLSNCAACHSSSGTGMILPDGTVAPKLYSTPPRQVAEAIRLGPGQMPRFGEGQLDQAKLNDIVTYVQTLGAPQVRGGDPLDQFGPIAEGIFVWVLPIPLLVLVIRLLGKKAPK